MGQEVAIQEPPRPALTAGHRPTAIVPTDMDSCFRLAKAVCIAGMAPKGLDTPEKAMVAIMHGLEVGLTPMAALQRIAVVNGRPTIWGDGAIGLVRGSGACEFIHERIDGEGDAMTATCEAKRKGEVKPIVGQFSVADAKKAGLWGKSGPWQQFPKRMLQMRARAFSLRDGFADVLGGLYLREEIEDERSADARDVTPRRAPPPAPAIAPPVEASDPVKEEVAPPLRRAPPPPPVAKEPPPCFALDREKLMDEFKDALLEATDEDSADDIYAQVVWPHESALADIEPFLQALRNRKGELDP